MELITDLNCWSDCVDGFNWLSLYCGYRITIDKGKFIYCDLVDLKVYLICLIKLPVGTSNSTSKAVYQWTKLVQCPHLAKPLSHIQWWMKCQIKPFKINDCIMMSITGKFYRHIQQHKHQKPICNCFISNHHRLLSVPTYHLYHPKQIITANRHVTKIPVIISNQTTTTKNKQTVLHYHD